jgi:hypothetical protein
VQGYLIGRPRPIEEYAEIANRPKNRDPKKARLRGIAAEDAAAH